MPGQRLNLLCLDGGGVRGLSSLFILQRLMHSLNPDQPPRPCEYFDMIGGTSTGGLIAIMLGRLRMSIDDCITAYIDLASKVFQKKQHRFKIRANLKVQALYDSKSLEDAVRQVVRECGLEEDALFKDTTPMSCKTFVSATSGGIAMPVLLRSYAPIRESMDLYNETKIWEAARATSAAPTYFDPIEIGRLRQKFLDGGTGTNNPVFHLWAEAKEVFCRNSERLEDNLGCVVSIGTGVPTMNRFGDGALTLMASLIGIATETENTANQFHQLHSDLDEQKQYFRFNAPGGLAEIGLDEARESDRIKDYTDVYLKHQDTYKLVLECVKSLGDVIDSEEGHASQNHLIPFTLSMGRGAIKKWIRRNQWQVSIANDTEQLILNTINRLSDYDQQLIQRRVLRQRCPGTVEWLDTSQGFNSWLEGSERTEQLWISGKVGSGKSIILATIIDKCIQRTQGDADSVVLHYFFQYPNYTAINLMRSLAKQLIGHFVATDKVLPWQTTTFLERAFSANGELEEFQLLFDVLAPCLKTVRSYILVIDGISDCEYDERAKILSNIRSLASHTNIFKLLLSSRNDFDVTVRFSNCRRIVVDRELATLDIETYVRHEMALDVGYGRLLDQQELRDEVTSQLVREADGMLLWVSLQLQLLRYECDTPSDVRHAVRSLPKTLESTYNRCLLSKRGNKLLCDHRILRWVCAAVAPIAVDHLRWMLAVDLTTGVSNADDMPSVEALLRSGVNLVVRDDVEDLMLPAHRTVRMYIFSQTAFMIMAPTFTRLPTRASYPGDQERCAFTVDEAKTEIAWFCLTHIKACTTAQLQIRHNPIQIPSISIAMPFRIQKYLATFFPLTYHKATSLSLTPIRRRAEKEQGAFLEYAIQNWPLYTTNIDCTHPLWDLFEAIALESNPSERIHAWSSIAGSRSSHLRGLFGFAVANNHLPLLRLVMNEKDAFPDDVYNLALPEHGQLPALHVAAKSGHPEIVSQLLTKCDLNGKSWPENRTALHFAAEAGSLAVVKILCARGPLVNIQDLHGQTPIWSAARAGHRDVVETLLAMKDINAEVRNIFERSPLWCATSHSHTAVVESLLRSMQVEPDQTDDNGRTLFSLAAELANIPVMKLLISTKAVNLDSRDKHGRTPLWYAALQGHEGVVRFLLEQGPLCVDMEDTDGQTALCRAISCGNSEVVKLLEQHLALARRQTQDVVDYGTAPE